MGLSWYTIGVNIFHMSISGHPTHVKAHTSCQTLALKWRMHSGGQSWKWSARNLQHRERDVWDIAYASIEKKKNVFPSMRQTLKDPQVTHAGILSVSHLCANTLMFQHFHPKWSIKEPEPVRCDKKTSIWRSQKAPTESSLLLQHEMHCCDKRASWILTTQARLWDVFFQLPLNGLLPTWIQRRDGTR